MGCCGSPTHPYPPKTMRRRKAPSRSNMLISAIGALETAAVEVVGRYVTFSLIPIRSSLTSAVLISLPPFGR